MQKFRPLLIAVILAVTASGCATVLPEQDALSDIHDIYRQEFAELFLSERAEQPQCLSNLEAATQPTFSKTRTAIRAYRVKFGTKQADAAHLTVLDAMMHLQVGNVGLAALLKSDVEAAKEMLVSKTGQLTRDYLFAEYFGPLVEGWRVVCDLTATPPKDVDQAAQRLEKASDEIDEGLTAAAGSGQLADPDVDQGAIYLATTAAIFNVWAVQQSGQLCIEQGICGCEAGDAGCPTASAMSIACASEPTPLDQLVCRQDARRDYFDNSFKPAKFAKSRDLMGRFLDDSEKMLAHCTSEDAMARSAGSSRLRYLSWYKFFHDRLPAATPTGSCPS
jgi:hypothetical protein